MEDSFLNIRSVFYRTPRYNPINMLKEPTLGPESHEKQREVEFAVEGQKIRGTLFYPESPKEKIPSLIFIHGWLGSQMGNVAYANEATQHGFACLAFDLRGHGKSAGDIQKLTAEEYLSDAEAAYDYLVSAKGIDPEDITIVSTSFGSYLAACLSEQRNVKNLILRAPANLPDTCTDTPVMDSIASPETLAWRAKAQGAESNRALHALKKFTGNILIIEPEMDTVIPHQTVENYLSAAHDPAKVAHVIMKGAPHSLHEPQYRSEYQRILMDWLDATHPTKKTD